MNSKHVLELSGIVSGLSHILMLKEQRLFIADVTSAASSTCVIFRHSSQLYLQTVLKIGVSYVFSNLRRGRLYQGTADETEVLVATSKTVINQRENNDCVECENKSASDLLSYKGTVTSCDPSLQLFVLDNSIQLVLMAIAGVTSCPQLLSGDEVVVHDAHWTPAEQRLTACACSRVDVISRDAVPTRAVLDSPVHTFHRFTLPPLAIDWYQRLAREISEIAGERKVPIGGEKGTLHQLLFLAGYQEVERTLTKEFVCSPHRCIVSVQFEAPFELSSVSELMSSAAAAAACAAPDDTWQHWVLESAERPLVAALCRDEVGQRLVRDQRSAAAPLLLLGTPPAAEPRAGRLVRLLRPRPVAEYVPAGAPLRYLMVRWADVTPLEGSELAPPAAAAGAARLLVCQRGRPRRGPDGCWCCVHGLLEEAGRRRPVLLSLLGETVRRAAQLRRGAGYLLRSADPLWTARQHGFRPLDKMRSYFPDCAVLRAPDDLEFVPDARTLAALSPDSAATLSVSSLSPDTGDSQLLSVQGVILDRWHARDKFAKHRDSGRPYLETHKIVLRLGDLRSPHEVALYLSEPARWCGLLGLVPGAELTVHAVCWAGRRGGAHLVTTALSELEVTGWCADRARPAAKRPRLHLPLRFLRSALPDAELSRWLVCCTVSDVRRASVTAECPLCQHRAAAGRCTFVGCHGELRPRVTARAKVVLDDGSATVMAQLVGDSVRQLLAVSDADWRQLTAEAEQSGEVYHIQPRHTAGGPPPPTNLLAVLCQAGAVRRPIVCELKRFAETQPAAVAAGPAESVFCEAAMDATAELVTRLFPVPDGAPGCRRRRRLS